MRLPLEAKDVMAKIMVALACLALLTGCTGGINSFGSPAYCRSIGIRPGTREMNTCTIPHFHCGDHGCPLI
jgi:hypothetical protein